MLLEKGAIDDKTRKNLQELVKPFFKSNQGTKLNDVISEVLSDKDLFLYMAKYSIKDSGIILGRMWYFDDIRMEVPYGITYDFNNPSLNIFTFESCPSYPEQEEKPIKTLQLSKFLSSEKSMGVNTHEDYSDYPTTEEFLSSLNRILQKNIKNQKPYWIDFNKPFYH